MSKKYIALSTGMYAILGWFTVFCSIVVFFNTFNLAEPNRSISIGIGGFVFGMGVMVLIMWYRKAHKSKRSNPDD